nr:zinc finger, CCHC-type [Tanacetum cinerariifolium]
LGHVHFKRMQDMSKDGLILAFDMDTEKWFEVVSLPDPKLKTLGERGIECIFVGYAEHYKTFRFYVILRPSLRIPNGTKDIGGLVVPEEGTRDEVSDQHSYCFNVEDDPKTFDETIKSQDVAFGKEMDVKPAFLNCELDEQVYMNQPHGFIMLCNENNVCKLIKSLYGLKHTLKQWHQKFDEVVLSIGYLFDQADKCVYSKFDESGGPGKEFLSSRFSMKDMGEDNVILSIRNKHESIGIAISHSHYIEKDTLMQVRSATLKTIHLPVAEYSCLVEVQFLGLPRNKLASLVQ